MAKDPAVLFYTSDFLSGVSFLTMEQRGQYITLLCEQHQIGHIPAYHVLAVCGSFTTPVLSKFKIDEHGQYYNERMETEGDKRKKFCESRRESIKKRYDPTHVATYVAHTNLRMDNGNDNGIDNLSVNPLNPLNPLTNTIDKPASIVKDKKIPIDIDEQILDAFTEYCKSRKHKPTDRAKQLIIEKLKKWYPDNHLKQIECLNQSTQNGWQGIFEIKTENNKNKGAQNGFGFQREEVISKYDKL